jgi:murein DD-endopeptidase MepM/ murein hydrolase activator NlpD
VSVRSGENVVRGKRIGVAGQSGLTTGVHVHYELLQNGKNVNPELYFFPDWAQSKS